MKYLKQFESNNHYYTEITRDEFGDFRDEDTADITESEIGLIENELLSYRLQFELTNPYRITMVEFSFITNDPYRGISIHKLKDEWFYVSIYLYNALGVMYYKCDQIEGVLRLLKQDSRKNENFNDNVLGKISIKKKI